MVKQLVTIDAALLTFGIAFLQNITKSRGPTDWINTAIIALIVSIAAGLVGLFSIVSETHSQSGSINANWVRVPLVLSLAAFAVAAFCIGWYVLKAPKAVL